MARNTYSPGKIDYLGNGRKSCPVEIEWEVNNGRFSMTGSIWMANRRDIYSGGQNLEEIAEYFPHDAKVQRMVEIWRRWHLNDMKAGTPAQEAFLREHAAEFPGYPVSRYEWAREILAANGLQPDGDYSYGSKWLTEEIPADVLAEIESWSS